MNSERALSNTSNHKEPHPAEAPPSAKRKPVLARRFSVVVSLLIVLAMCVFWIINSYHTRSVLQQQSDALGNTLAQQTAVQLTELLLANDLISINVVLGSLVEDSIISEIAVLNVDNDIVALANGTPSARTPLFPLPVSFPVVHSEYSATIRLANSTAGSVQLILDTSYIETVLADNLALTLGATLVLILAAHFFTSIYYQYLVSFPANLLAYGISNIRKGEIDTCPEPENNTEISNAIRQFNATAEFLAQNTFLQNFSADEQAEPGNGFDIAPGLQSTSLLLVRLANFEFLSSTLDDTLMVKMLNKLYYMTGKIAQLYSGDIFYCHDGEILVNFNERRVKEEQAFYAICAGQLFLQLRDIITQVEGTDIDAKFCLGVLSSEASVGLYSPLSGNSRAIRGSLIEQGRQLLNECPDNSLLIEENAFELAGAGSRVEADKYSEDAAIDGATGRTFLALAPIGDYKLLLERQASQLANLFPVAEEPVPE